MPGDVGARNAAVTVPTLAEGTRRNVLVLPLSIDAGRTDIRSRACAEPRAIPSSAASRTVPSTATRSPGATTSVLTASRESGGSARAAASATDPAPEAVEARHRLHDNARRRARR